MIANHDAASALLTRRADAPIPRHTIGKLKLAGLVRSRRDGKHQICYLDDPRVAQLVQIALPKQDEPRAKPARRRRARAG
jgi:DNA-binding transcriptional ArsR family regulator